MPIDQHHLTDGIATPAPIDGETSTDRDRVDDLEQRVDRLEGGVTEIGTRSQFLEILESNGTTVRDWSHESGTLMGLHIEMGGEPSGIGDVSGELSLISKAWWGG